MSYSTGNTLPFAQLLELRSHPADTTLRSSTHARTAIHPHTVLFRETPFAVSVPFDERGKRCDTCLRERETLMRCTRCKSEWYCDRTCQIRAWTSYHKRLCPLLPRLVCAFQASSLPTPIRTAAILLARLVAAHFPEPSLPEIDPFDLSSPASAFLALLPSTVPSTLPDLLSPILGLPPKHIQALLERFGRNNHSLPRPRLDGDGIGDAVLPMTSRTLNHSCWPASVVEPVWGREGLEVRVRTIREVSVGEEVTISYVDPALPFPDRQSELFSTYGFTCACSRCSPPSPLPHAAPALPLPELLTLSQPLLDLSPVSASQLPLLVPPNLSLLASTFSRLAHAPQSALTALEAGRAVLKIYKLIYPAFHPLIGLHALELAKVAWNAWISGGDEAAGKLRMGEVRDWLNLTRKVLRWDEEVDAVVGGEEVGEEARLLFGLVDEELKRL